MDHVYYKRAQDILNIANVPSDVGVWMSYDTYIKFGGSQEYWDKHSEDGLIYLEGK